MSGRHIMVTAQCEYCGEEYQVRQTKFKAGKAKYCSKACHKEVQKFYAKQLYGYEKGKKYFDAGRWIVRWYDDLGKVHVTSYQKWYYETHIGEIPSGMLVTFADGDVTNIDPSNFILVTRKYLCDKNCVGGWKHSATAIQKMRKSKLGDNYISGIDLASYPVEFNRARRRIRKRDKGICRICSTACVDSWQVHHIDADKNNNTDLNLILLCGSCHHKIHAISKTSDPVILAFRSQLYRSG